MGERAGKGGQDWQRDVMLGGMLTRPRWLQNNILLLPLGLGLVVALIVYFPTFSPTVFLFGVVAWPLLAMWSVRLFFWARRRRLGDGSVADRSVLLETTGEVLPLQTAWAPVLGLLFALAGTRFAEAAGLIDSRGCAYAVVVYLVVLGTSYLALTDWMVRLELDRLNSRPATRLGRLLRPGMPNFTAMAICGTVLFAVLVRVGGGELFVAVCGLLAALYMVQVSVVNLERWRRFGRFMRTERERFDDRTAKD